LRKIIFVILVFICAGCSVIKNGKRSEAILSGVKDTGSLNQILVRQNITAKGFYLKKAEIKISSDDGVEKILASIKFEYPDKYLITIRSKTGIEAARIFISSDTILVNDRINRKLYYGKPYYLKTKYGVTTSVLPVILGDYINENRITTSTDICSSGTTDIDAAINGVRIRYNVDCKRGKTISAYSENEFEKKGIDIKYGSFMKVNDILIPGKIIFNVSEKLENIELKILSIDYPWAGKIDFIPGSKYELIQLR
jgi:hypothetical protein